MQTASPSSMEDTRTFSDTDSPSPKSSDYSHFCGSDCQSDYDSQSLPEYYSVEISNIEMHHIPKVGWNSLDDRFWLQIIADGKMKETSVASRGSLSWKDKFTFNVRKSSKLSFQLYAWRYVHEHEFIGEVGKCVDKLPEHMLFKGWHNPRHNNTDLERTTLICGITKKILPPEEAAAEAATAQQLRISNIVVHHLPKIKLVSLDDHFFVQIEVDDKVACITDVRRGHSLRWKNEYPCNYRKDSRIQLKIFAQRRVHKDQLVYLISDNVESLLQRGSITEQLSNVNQVGKEHEIPPSIEFQITSSTSSATGGLRHPDVIPGPVPDHGSIADEIAPTATSVEISGKISHVPHTAVLSLQVYARGSTDEYIGMVTDPISIFLQGSGRYDGQLFAFDNQSKINLETKLSFQIRRCQSSYGHRAGSVCSVSTQPSDPIPQQYAGDAIVTVGATSTQSRDLITQQNARDTIVDVGATSKQSRDCITQQAAGDVIAAVGAISTQPMDSSSQQYPSNALVAVGTMAVGSVAQVQAATQFLSVQAGQTFLDNTVNVFEPLLSRIDTFVKIGRTFSEAHPYTKMAFMVLTAGYEVIRRQHARDESIRKLTSTMCDTYNLVLDAQDLCRFQDQQKTVTLLARQTIECAYFIRDYALHKSGSKHCITNVFSNVDATILTYETAFSEIMAALEQKVVLNTQLAVCHIHDALKDLAAKVDLNALPYATGASYHAQKGYDNIPVKEDLLMEISDWVNDQSSPAIYLLIGPCGSEASAAAHLVARRFDDISRLGSSYCLDRTRQTQQQPTNLFSTIARDLADHDPEFMACLSDKVKRKSMCSSPHIPTQFDFILAPAQQLTSFGPMLVVIDALDACGNPNSRVDVLSVLKEKAQHLPPSFKFLITCLPDTDVTTALRGCAHVLSKGLDTVVTKQLCDEGSTVDRIKPRPETPPIQTALSQPDYFALSKYASGVSNMSSSSLSSVTTSIFDGPRPFSPDSDMSSPASSIIPFTDAGSPKRFLGTIKRIEATEEFYSYDADGRLQVRRTSLKQTVKQHATSTPRRALSCTRMLDEPNAHAFISEPTEDTLGVDLPRCESPRPQTKRCAPFRHETLLRSEIQTTEPSALLSP
ncbi:hypothetical protein AZE42_03231 [Rhizopogon vesiculosus]|uniref:C2 domain-containing protein n=1 Tax=Rhizopogon vesiculosus TaxID=180088 RepID=A0A1J8QNH7_9AGAM|nr:hypothetical protein AZE42_03231 [Rhizopogon vesiculosus]